MRLHVLNAGEGDCLLLDTGMARLLIDGGPAGTWSKHAKPYLDALIGAAGTLDAVCVSHVDADHITGVLDLLAGIEADVANRRPAFSVGDLWYNSFSSTVDTDDQRIAAGLENLLDAAGQAMVAMPDASSGLFGIAEGARLRRSAVRVGVAVNAAFGGSVISPDALPDPRLRFGDATITVIGPTRADLDELRAEWLRWLEANAEAFAAPGPDALANSDRSVPNLSSVVLHVEERGRTLLLTGDARGDHIMQGLASAGLLDHSLHVNTLKVQHHGSDRNATYGFFARVTADRYVISANGRHGNPDHETLVWIVEAAEATGRPIEIVVTNEAAALDELRRSHPPDRHGYALTVPGGHGAAFEI